MNRSSIASTATIATVLITLTVSAQATVFSLSGPIDGTQEAPPSGSPGTGAVSGTYDDVSNQVSWSISFSNLTTGITAMHFHGPAAAGNNAGIQVDIGAISGLTSPSAGNTTISGAQGTDLKNGLWYVNIHTVGNPAGEIRGQVIATPVPEPTTSTLASH